MSPFSRMPRYDIRNDGAGPYAIFYCDICGREFRSQPDVANVVKQDLGKAALGGFLRKVPLVGSSMAENVVGEDQRYSYKLSPAQLESAWNQCQVHFRECPTCNRIVCLSDFDAQSGYCNEDSPRTNEISVDCQDCWSKRSRGVARLSTDFQPPSGADGGSAIL